MRLRDGFWFGIGFFLSSLVIMLLIGIIALIVMFSSGFFRMYTFYL